MCVFFFCFLVTINQDLEQFKRKKQFISCSNQVLGNFKKISLTDFFFKIASKLDWDRKQTSVQFKKKNFSRKFKHKRILILFISLKNVGFKELVSCII